MADLRFDPISGIWIAIASKRRERPMEFIPLEQIHKQIICPFCRGSEEETPEAIAAYSEDGSQLTPDDDQSNWTVRVVPNKFPSLSEESSRLECGPFSQASTDGFQEVIIPTARHVTSLSELSVQELSVCFRASQDRIGSLRLETNIEHLMLFMNCRLAAGASLGHIHLQLMGSTVASPYLEQRMKRNSVNLKERGECLLTSLLNWEIGQATRVIKETENFVMLCPYASRFSFQVWIAPKNPELPFSDQLIDFNSELAALCRLYVKKLEQLVEKPAYNLLLNLAPIKYAGTDHWFIEIFPRLNQMAGFELGTSIWVNPVPPETAARQLQV